MSFEKDMRLFIVQYLVMSVPNLQFFCNGRIIASFQFCKKITCEHDRFMIWSILVLLSGRF